jgi:hypothetical protein
MNPWICPRCNTVWAGWVPKCTCKRVYTVGSGSASTVVCTCNTTGGLDSCPVHKWQVTNG